MAAKRKDKKTIAVTVPAGSVVSRSLLKEAQQAAQAVIDRTAGLLALQAVLKKQGFSLTLEQVAQVQRGGAAPKAAGKRKGGRRAAKKAAKEPTEKVEKVAKKSTSRKRKVLSKGQRDKVVATLQSGATAGAVAKSFGVSLGTINNIKKAAGLVSPRAKK